ncbi:MAG: hypothetical protein JNL92_19455 [Opitutaceae bacterium]|nr:hypothetical protein [Opitutaceae bacterium]
MAGLPHLTASAAPAPEAGDFFFFLHSGIRVSGQAIFLAIDDQSLPLRENLVEHLSKPAVRREPVVSPDKDNPAVPDQVAAHFYGTLLHDEGRYRMWYYPVGLKEPGDARRADLKHLTQGPICFAESEDGVQWTKPILNQAEFRGSRRNNAIALPGEVGAFLLPEPARQLSVEVSDEHFDFLPGHSGPHAGRAAAAGGLDCAVAWPRDSLAALGSRTVRFKINFERIGDTAPRLFALYLQRP